MKGDLKPGDVTTLGNLRPGDVGEFSNNPDGGKFVVTDVLPSESLTWIQYQHDTKPHARYSEQVVGGGWKVRYLGRGRIEPARIVMEGEPDRIAELEEQVLALQKLVKPKSDIPCCVKCGRWMSEHWDFPDRCEGFVIPETIELTIAATAPKGEP